MANQFESNQFPNINIEDAQFIYQTNFKGEKRPFNNYGDRNFNVILEGEALRQAEEYGMNIKYTKPYGDQEPIPFIKVNVGYKVRPPHAELINSHCKRYLTEETIGLLDDYEFEKVELVIRPRKWHNRDNNTSGVSAYLAAIYAIVLEDPFVAKYYDIPEINGEVSEE